MPKNKKSANIAFELFGLLCFEDELSNHDKTPLKGKMVSRRRKSRNQLDVALLLRTDNVIHLTNLFGADLNLDLWHEAIRDPEYLVTIPPYEIFCQDFINNKEFGEKITNAFKETYPLLTAFLIANSFIDELAITQIMSWLESKMERSVSEHLALLLKETQEAAKT